VLPVWVLHLESAPEPPAWALNLQTEAVL